MSNGDPISGASAASQLGVSMTELWALRQNPSFPPALTDSGTGQDLTFDGTAFATFLALWQAAQANGWTIAPAGYASFNFTYAAATAPGAFYGCMQRALDPFET